MGALAGAYDPRHGRLRGGLRPRSVLALHGPRVVQLRLVLPGLAVARSGEDPGSGQQPAGSRRYRNRQRDRHRPSRRLLHAHQARRRAASPRKTSTAAFATRPHRLHRQTNASSRAPATGGALIILWARSAIRSTARTRDGFQSAGGAPTSAAGALALRILTLRMSDPPQKG
jgi:hypothetical protein